MPVAPVAVPSLNILSEFDIDGVQSTTVVNTNKLMADLLNKIVELLSNAFQLAFEPVSSSETMTAKNMYEQTVKVTNHGCIKSILVIKTS